MAELESAAAAVVSDALDRLGTRQMLARPRHTFGTNSARFRHRFSATLPDMRTIATPWGKAVALEQVSVAQRAGERRFSTVVELLETSDGERLVRFAYTTDGSARRGPVTLRAKDVERMHKLLERTPELREALGR
jgi:hypothetical protein